MGARKKARVTGGSKENISDALWKSGVIDQENGVVMLSPKKQRMSTGPGDMDAFVVPRKRTNANHLITPRKPGRKIPLMEQTQTQVTISASSPARQLVHSRTELSPRKMPLNDGELAQDGKNSVEASPQKLPLNDLDRGEDGVTVLAEKPVRRRKSLRRSTRRLTRGTTPEQPPAAPAEEVLAEPVEPIFETTKGPATINSEMAIPAVEAEPTDLEFPRNVPRFEAVQEPVLLEATEEALPDSRHESGTSVAYPPATPKGAEETLTYAHGDSQTSRKAQDNLPSNEAEPAMNVKEPFIVAANATPKSQLPVLRTIEVSSETQFVSPAKAAGTPRQRRKTPSRRGSRRSVRSTRATSVPPEDQINHLAPEPQDSNPASSPIKSRMLKTPTRKSRRSTVHSNSTEAAMNQNIKATTPASDPNVEIKRNDQQVESTEAKDILTTQQSDSTPHLEPVLELILSRAEAGGEIWNLPTAETVKEALSVEGVVNTEEVMSAEEVALEVSTAAVVASSENGHVSHLEKPSRSEKLAQHTHPTSGEAREGSVEALETLEPITLSTEKLPDDSMEEPTDQLPESSTPNPSTTELVEAISENAPATIFDHDDTDMLRNFLTRVKANKAAKAGTFIPKRKRSLPHSPIRLPLESVDAALSPSSPKLKDEFDVSLPAHLATKRKQDDADMADDEGREPKSIRRSGRTRLPVKAAPLAAPSFIPVRRLGQDGDNTVTLRRNEEKELAALTRVNTRKNKGGAQLPMQVLAKQAEEKEDPASRQRALKEVFDEKAQRQKKGTKRKTVVWAEELAQFQTEEGKLAELEKEPVKEKEKAVPVEEKMNAVKVGVRSKMTLGMAVNGTPAPKRKMRGRS